MDFEKSLTERLTFKKKLRRLYNTHTTINERRLSPYLMHTCTPLAIRELRNQTRYIDHLNQLFLFFDQK